MDRDKIIWRLALAGYGAGLIALVAMGILGSHAAFQHTIKLVFLPFLIGMGCNLRFEYLRTEAGLRDRWEWFSDPGALFDPLPHYPDLDFMRKLTLLSLGAAAVYFFALACLFML